MSVRWLVIFFLLLVALVLANDRDNTPEDSSVDLGESQCNDAVTNDVLATFRTLRGKALLDLRRLQEDFSHQYADLGRIEEEFFRFSDRTGYDPEMLLYAFRRQGHFDSFLKHALCTATTMRDLNARLDAYISYEIERWAEIEHTVGRVALTNSRRIDSLAKQVAELQAGQRC